MLDDHVIFKHMLCFDSWCLPWSSCHMMLSVLRSFIWLFTQFCMFHFQPYNSWAYTPKTIPFMKCLSSMFIVALFILHRNLNQPRCSSADESKLRCGPYTQWSIIQLLRKTDLQIPKQMMGPEIVILCEIMQILTDKGWMFFFISGF